MVTQDGVRTTTRRYLVVTGTAQCICICITASNDVTSSGSITDIRALECSDNIIVQKDLAIVAHENVTLT